MEVAEEYILIGDLYEIQCLYDKAIGFYQKALRIHQHILGELHPEIAVDYNEIGHAYFMQRKLCKALDYLERSFFILRDTLGESDPQTLSCLRNLLFLKQQIEQPFQ